MHNVLRKVSEFGRVTVSGFNVRVNPRDDVERALRELFTSCGEITDVCVHMRISYIYFLGEGATDKALQLNGSDVGGWNVSVEPFPYPEHANDYVVLRVEGYDTSLSKIDIQSALSNLFSPYGEFHHLSILEGYAQVSIVGKDIADKALELNGSVMGGRKLAVEVLCRPFLPTTHRRRRYRCSPPGLPPCTDPDSSTSDVAIPQSRSESSKTPDKPVEKKKRFNKEEATSTLKKCKTIPTLVEKQTPDLAGLVVYDICMGDGKKADPGKSILAKVGRPVMVRIVDVDPDRSGGTVAFVGYRNTPLGRIINDNDDDLEINRIEPAMLSSRDPLQLTNNVSFEDRVSCNKRFN